MIATRNDLVTAKQLLDNLDQVTAALANLGTGATVTVAIVGRPNPVTVVVAVPDATAFLTTMQTKLTAALKAVGVTV